MPEGDTIFRAARTLNRALAGQMVAAFESVLVQLTRIDDQSPIAGRRIEGVEARGKHLLIRFSGSLVLRTHMRMNGSWHIYRPGERWQLPRSQMRIVIATDHWVAVAFRVHVAEFIAGEKTDRHRPLSTLGPDLLSDGFDADEAIRRIRTLPDRPIEEVLLDQRALAGIGNIYKSESLFLAGVHPETAASALDTDALRNVIAIARRLLRDNVAEDATVRRTTRRMRGEDRYWVYGRGGQPCRRCGAPIAARKKGDAARITYWCPNCQPTR